LRCTIPERVITPHHTPPGAAVPVAEQTLESFDGGTRFAVRVQRPERYREVEAPGPESLRIVRGGGYSYAAASFGPHSLVQDNSRFDRILDFDPVMGTMECEGGVTLERIFEVATPAGWYLAVQPGYPGITVGGCIASDVHGKNPFRDGTFRRQVVSIKLFHPSHGVMVLDPGSACDPFDLTCGGLGLTGHILSARLRLTRFGGGRILRRRIAIGSARDTIAVLEEHAGTAEFVYTWQNVTVAGVGFGRGFLYAGSMLEPDPGQRPRFSLRTSRPVPGNRGRWRWALLNDRTARVFNATYAMAQALEPSCRDLSLFESLFPVARRVRYFSLFGKAGFCEYQILMPRQAFVDFIKDLERDIGRLGTGVTLASCKLFRGRPSLLRFDGDGICIAIDFRRGDAGERLARRLDELTPAYGGIPNIVKDSRLPRAVVRACYPQFDAFASALQAFDPKRIYRSEVSERLGL
jgi:decaprenylphospho-beta-D-ribofuranose 2-oxidase